MSRRFWMGCRYRCGCRLRWDFIYIDADSGVIRRAVCGMRGAGPGEPPHCAYLLLTDVREEFFHSGDVGGDVHAYGVVIGFDYIHAKAVFEPAELFQLLEGLELAGRKRGEFEKSVAAETVE